MVLANLAKEYGFSDCFLFPNESFEHYKRRLYDGALHHAGTDLVGDIKSDYPWANAVVALILHYRPYADSIPVSRYYSLSNNAYHAANIMVRSLNQQGIRMERAYVPIRELLTRSGIGIPLKNGLTAIPAYGTRFCVQTFLIDLPNVAYTQTQDTIEPRCNSCHACEQVCPTHAIDDSGYSYQKCARAYMGGEPMEDWVMDAMSSILGCELCQRVCPYNQDIEPINEMPEAFALENILSGTIKPALQIVGTNLKKNGRLQQHACIIAAKQNRRDLMPLIVKWKEDPREAVQVAADYALRRLNKL